MTESFPLRLAVESVPPNRLGQPMAVDAKNPPVRAYILEQSYLPGLVVERARVDRGFC